MFRNKVLVRAATASPSSSGPLPPFLLRQLSLPIDVPIPSVDLDILCCRLSRRHRLACLPQPPADALLVYQRCQSREAAEAVSEIVAVFPGAAVGEEEELVCSGMLVAKAVECGLRSLMLEHGWRCLGESIYVESAFGESEERSDLCAVNVEVRLGRNDDFEFVVSPDAFRFTTHKIPDAASSHMMETLQHGVVLDSCNFLTVCTTLPTLEQGHVIGYSKILPSEQCLDKFMELCSLKHGLDTNYNYHVAVKLTYGASLETQWLPSTLVLQGSGLQPALKSVRASKAMSSLQSFADVLKAWNFFGLNQLVIKEQLLLNCTATLPAWDKAASNLTLHTARTDNGKDQPFILDFRTPKPAVFCSLTATSWDTKVHMIAHSLVDNDNLSSTSPNKYGCQSEPLDLSSSFKSQVTLLKPSFSRTKPAEKRKMRYSSEHPGADNLTKSSYPDATASHANPVTSSGSSLHTPVIQVSENQRKHAKLLKNSCQGGGGIAKGQQSYLEKRNLDTRRKSKEYTPGIPGVAEAIRDTEKDEVLNPTLKSVVAMDDTTAKARTIAEQDLDKKECTAVIKQKTMPEVVKDEFARKVRGHQNDETNKKVKKPRAKSVDKNFLNSITRTKAKPDVVNEELITKVIDHHRRGELRLLTVADLKGFLGAKKTKVGGTKEVLIQRATELLA